MAGFILMQIAGFFGTVLILAGLIGTIAIVRKEAWRKYLTLSILIWSLPLTTFLMTFRGSNLARSYSRSVAIKNASSLITAVRAYQKSTDRYPDRLSQLVPEYLDHVPSPGIMGITGYLYNANDSSFFISFSQTVSIGMSTEINTYDSMNRPTGDGELSESKDSGYTGWSYYISDF